MLNRLALPTLALGTTRAVFCVGWLAQSCWMPAERIAAPIFAISVSTSFFRYSGERSSRGATFATISLNRSCTHGASRVVASDALSFRTIGSGVPFGKNKPNQVLTSNSGSPCSAGPESLASV